MTVTVTPDKYESSDQALAAFAANGLHTMSLDVPPVENNSHWHHFDSEFHITTGYLTLTDVGSGAELKCGPGSTVRVPAKALHAELSQTGYSIVLGTSVPPEEFGDPVDLAPETLPKNELPES